MSSVSELSEIPIRVLTEMERPLGSDEKISLKNSSKSVRFRSIPAPFPFATTVPLGQPKFRFTS